MKKKRTGIVLIILLLVINGISLTACESPSSPLVGRWMRTDISILQYTKFFNDGRMQWNIFPNSPNGTYEIDSNRVIITMESLGQDSAGEPVVTIYEYKIEGDTLTLTAEEETLEYRRIE